MSCLSKYIVGALCLLFSLSVHAVPITINTIAANWSDVTTSGSGSTLNYFDTDGIAGNEEIRWGTPVSSGGETSGYRFNSAAPPSFVVDTDVIFSLGDFIHINQPIFASDSLTSAVLNITADLTIEGSSISEGPFNFSFLHDETTNACNPLPSCANDLVSFSNLVTSDTFTIGSIEYTLELIGFSVAGILTNTFSTTEGISNTAQLMAVFRTPTTVPTPIPLILLSIGLLGIGFANRRKKYSPL